MRMYLHIMYVGLGSAPAKLLFFRSEPNYF